MSLCDTIYIIGGGISGLYLCDLLSSFDKNVQIHLYEKNQTFGGRIKTVYENDNVLYESGPWRIHKSQKRCFSFFQNLGANIVPIEQKKTFKFFQKLFPKKTQIDNTMIENNQVTQYQYNVLTTNIPFTNQKMVKTGYDNIYQQAYGSNSYGISKDSKSNKRTDTEEDGFFVVQEGFSWGVEKLVNILQKRKNVFLHANTRVENIRQLKRGYQLDMIERNLKKNNSFTTFSKKTTTIIVAVPPSDMMSWSVSKIHLKPNLYSLDSIPLMHIMAKSRTISKKPFKYIVNNPLSQIVSSCFSNSWFQISYSAGRMAMLWENLRLIQKTLFEKYLLENFYTLFPSFVKIDSIVPHFWRHAVHYWLPNRKLSKQTLCALNITPNQNKLPNFYWIGEAISTHQGWMEGALETSELVFEKIKEKQKNKKQKKSYPKEYVIYDGRILNVEKWKHVHPGSKAAIENHLFQDITDLWNQYHPDGASKYFLGLEDLNG